MKNAFLMIVLFCCCIAVYAQNSVICSFENNRISVDDNFIDNTFIDLMKNSSNLDVLKYDITYISNYSGQLIKIEAGLNKFDPEDGFNEIKISKAGLLLLHIGGEDMWTYVFGGSKHRYDRFDFNRYYIPLLSNKDITLFTFVGWPYGGELPLLTLVAVTDSEAKVVYNRHAAINKISESPFEMTLETVLVEYGEGGVPFNEQEYHKIKYVDNRLVYE